MMDTLAFAIAAPAVGAAIFIYGWISELRADAEYLRAHRDRLVDRISEMERREAAERKSGADLHAKHKALQHRFASVLGEARAWRKRAVALGWTKEVQ